MLEFTIDSSIMASMLNIFRPLFGKFLLQCHESGMFLQTLDEGNLAMVHMAIHSHQCLFYRCDQSTQLGISIPPLLALVDDTSPGDVVTIKQIDDDVIHVHVKTKARDKLSHRECEINLDTTLEPENLVITETTNYRADVHLKSQALAFAVNHANRFNSNVTVACPSASNLTVSTEGPEGEVKISIHDIECEFNEPASVVFQSKLLQKFTKTATLCSTCSLALTQNEPCRLRYYLPVLLSSGSGDSGNKKGRRVGADAPPESMNVDDEVGHITFYVAPYEADGAEDEESSKAEESAADG